ncbi:MAG: septum formation family protein [Actinomycetota bacterium]|nr:septum formation family protein [Actinomycetota bacterium]
MTSFLIAGLLTGCGTTLQPAKVDSATAGKANAPPSSTPTAAPSVPTVGECYRLGIDAATSPTTHAPPVSCKREHTSVTVYVGKIDPIVDGHLLAVDAKAIQNQIATTCPTKVPGWIGGTEDARRLSRFAAIWFSPTLQESDAGADWFRCDLVAVGARNKLAPLPGKVRGALDSATALDTFGTCGSSAPSDKGFEQLICSRPHSWRAVTVVPIPQDARYLGPNIQNAGDATCKLEAQQRATNPLVYKWSFEWPTKSEWDSGRRYGLCWVPSTK